MLITIDESGIPVKEEMTNTENNSMYELLRELIINLAKLNWTQTKDIVIQKLDKQVNFIIIIAQIAFSLFGRIFKLIHFQSNTLILLDGWIGMVIR